MSTCTHAYVHAACCLSSLVLLTHIALPCLSTHTRARHTHTPAYRTPCVRRIYDALPQKSRTGRVQLLLPDGLPSHSSSSSSGVITSRLPLGGSSRQRVGSSSSSSHRADGSVLFGDGGCVSAAVLHLAATGDQGFGRRLKLGGPLLSQVRVWCVEQFICQHSTKPRGAGTTTQEVHQVDGTRLQSAS